MSIFQPRHMPKRKGDKGGNPNPLQTPEFIAKQYKPQDGYEGELSKKVLGVVVPVEVDQAVRALPHKAAWLRRVITEAAQRELMG